MSRLLSVVHRKYIKVETSVTSQHIATVYVTSLILHGNHTVGRKQLYVATLQTSYCSLMTLLVENRQQICIMLVTIGTNATILSRMREKYIHGIPLVKQRYVGSVALQTIYHNRVRTECQQTVKTTNDKGIIRSYWEDERITSDTRHLLDKTVLARAIKHLHAVFLVCVSTYKHSSVGQQCR